MSRVLRIEFPGAYYHITTRGNARSDIYLNDECRRYSLPYYNKSMSVIDGSVMPIA